MDEYAARQALRAMSPRMPGADIASLVVPVTQAWNDHRAGGPLMATMAVIADATWRPGYTAGTAHGHAFVTDFFATAAQRHLTGDASRLNEPSRLNEQSQRLLRAVAGTAAAIAKAEPTVTDEGPSRYDYLTAMGDANGDTDPERAAIAARVGWQHGYHTGDADAAWSAAGRIVSTVKDLLGTDTLQAASLDGLSAKDWLTRLDVTSREHSERDVMYPRSATAQAFAPLREVRADTARDAAAGPSGTLPQQRQGRRR